MSITTFDQALLPLAGTDVSVKSESRPGFFSRLITAMQESRQRAAQREIERFNSTYRLHLGAYDRDLHLIGRNDLPFQG